MLHFGMKPPFSFVVFLQKCQDLISGDDLAALESAADREIPLPPGSGAETSRRWRQFEQELRNELAKLRAARKKTDPLKYIRHDGSSQPSVIHIALSAYRNTSLMDAEKTLDMERWRFLDELTVGHYFDIDALLVYASKLLILLRWDKINRADKTRLLQEALELN